MEWQAVAGLDDGELIRERLCALIGWDDMINGGESALRIEDLQPKITQHSKSLRAGDFVNKVRADQQLCGSVGQFAHPMRLPYLIQQCRAHSVW